MIIEKANQLLRENVENGERDSGTLDHQNRILNTDFYLKFSDAVPERSTARRPLNKRDREKKINAT